MKTIEGGTVLLAFIEDSFKHCGFKPNGTRADRHRALYLIGPKSGEHVIAVDSFENPWSERIESTGFEPRGRRSDHDLQTEVLEPAHHSGPSSHKWDQSYGSSGLRFYIVCDSERHL